MRDAVILTEGSLILNASASDSIVFEMYNYAQNLNHPLINANQTVVYIESFASRPKSERQAFIYFKTKSNMSTSSILDNVWFNKLTSRAPMLVDGFMPKLAHIRMTESGVGYGYDNNVFTILNTKGQSKNKNSLININLEN